MPAKSKQRVYSALEVARICGVVNQTVINWIRAGHLSASVTPGGQFRIYPDDLKAFLESKGMRVPEDVQALVSPPVPTILIVEDDEGLNELLQTQLQLAFPKARLLAAYDGFEAGSMLGVHKPQAVLLDLNLPGVDGMELCRRIKQEPGFDQPLVVAMTASDDEALEGRLRSLGADAFLRKPFAQDALVKVLRAVIAPLG